MNCVGNGHLATCAAMDVGERFVLRWSADDGHAPEYFAYGSAFVCEIGRYPVAITLQVTDDQGFEQTVGPVLAIFDGQKMMFTK